jgi:arylsulfatase A-like enzyme
MSLSRRGFLEETIGGTVAAGALAGNLAAASSQPNILYVILEDIGPQLACYGEPLVSTPNLDRFASQSVRFANAFCTGPVCSASRSALMTGCYQTQLGAHQHRTWQWRKRTLPSPVRHVSQWFRDAGYFTCNLQPAPDQRRGGVYGAAGAGKVDLNFLLNAPDPNGFFDGYDWKQRKANQPFFAHITIIETHKGEGWKIGKHHMNPSGEEQSSAANWRGEQKTISAARTVGRESRAAEKQRSNGAGVLPRAEAQ